MNSNCVIREAVAGPDDDAVVSLIVDYLNWGRQRLHEEYRFDEALSDVGSVRTKLQEYRPPRGFLLVADCGGEIVGTCALRWLEASVGEVKRLYVAPAWREAHLGSALLDRLIEAAADAGAALLRLDTFAFMTDAQSLYRRRGFVTRSQYNQRVIPAELKPYWLFFERQL